MLDFLNYVYTLLLLQVDVTAHVGLWGQAVDIAVCLVVVAFFVSFFMALVSIFKTAIKKTDENP